MKVFFSYASQDEKLARDLIGRVAKAGHDVWDPAHDLLPGDNWALKMGKALESSEAMIVLLSPGGMESPWVARDIEFALGSPKYAGRLIPVIAEPTEGIPWILRHLKSLRVGKDLAALGRRILDRLEEATGSGLVRQER